MTAWSQSRGNKIVFNAKTKRWETPDGEPWHNDKEFCNRCGKPALDINGVENCDFCLQGLSNCDFIEYACCGHGDDDAAYIALKDGRKFILDPMKWCDD